MTGRIRLRVNVPDNQSPRSGQEFFPKNDVRRKFIRHRIGTHSSTYFLEQESTNSSCFSRLQGEVHAVGFTLQSPKFGKIQKPKPGSLGLSSDKSNSLGTEAESRQIRYGKSIWCYLFIQACIYSSCISRIEVGFDLSVQNSGPTWRFSLCLTFSSLQL